MAKKDNGVNPNGMIFDEVQEWTEKELNPIVDEGLGRPFVYNENVKKFKEDETKNMTIDEVLARIDEGPSRKLREEYFERDLPFEFNDDYLDYRMYKPPFPTGAAEERLAELNRLPPDNHMWSKPEEPPDDVA